MTEHEPLTPPAGETPSERPPAGLLRRLVTATVFSYGISLALLVAGLELIGERWWPLAVLLYLPQQLFWLPLIVLVPAALLADAPRGAYRTLAGCVIIFFWHVPFYLGIGGGAGPGKMKVMTNNYGNNHRLSIQPFITAEDPDFVALEDAGGAARGFHLAYPDRSVVGIGQFVFISKAPVKSARLLDWPTWRGWPVAAVFDTEWQGKEVVFYAVHLPTPRGDFAKLAGLGLVKELAGRNRRRSDNLSFGESMTARVELGREMATVFAAEKRPFIAMGDFNMPSQGYVHREVTWGMTDCFARAGRGFGFTFPCDGWNPLTLGGPWLRIDYVLAGPGWRVGECRVEPGRRSEHRAVVATVGRD